MIIYLAGKITGNPEYRKQFAAAKAELKAEGHIVLNPAELPEGMSPAAYMRICFAMIDTADELRALPGGIAAAAQGWKWPTPIISEKRRVSLIAP